jgi:hypothetical protein
MRRPTLVLAAAFALAAPPAHAGKTQTEAAKILTRAIAQVYKADPACRGASPFDSPPTFTDATPSAELLATLGVLRREPTAEETALDLDSLFHRFPPADGIFRRHVRLVTAADGTRYLVVPAQNTNRLWATPEPCIAAVEARVRRRLRGRNAKLRRTTMRLFGQFRDVHAGAAEPAAAHEGVFLFAFKDGRVTGGGGGGGAGEIKERGLAGASGDRKSTTVHSLVPDGVSSVTFRFRKRPRTQLPRNFPRLRAGKLPRPVTGRVVDNLASIRIRTRAWGFMTFGSDQTWRAADGTVIRRPEG